MTDFSSNKFDKKEDPSIVLDRAMQEFAKKGDPNVALPTIEALVEHGYSKAKQYQDMLLRCQSSNKGKNKNEAK